MNRTRREFIVEAIAAATLVSKIEAATPQQNPALLKAMDVIIPAGDGMPSASEAGGMRYLTTLMDREPAIAAEIERCLAALEAVSKKSFDQLSNEEAISALTHFEAQDPAQFASLRDYIYESYYTQPAVWKLIGYQFYPTDHPGSHMQPFDESVLAPVRDMPRHYREDGASEEGSKNG